ncbi:MAG: hypothetical protein HYZ50_21940 [Deltaproteobacteria bacterium]|nr:hypothetical protein [Deltaproteobacteria bacterium]
MKPIIEKVVREFVARVDGLEFSVKARISETLAGEDVGTFYWAISHYYSATENGQAYAPGTRTFSTLADAEMTLMLYLRGFTSFGVQPDRYY